MQFLLESGNLSDFDKSEYKKLLDSGMSKAVFCSGLKTLSELLEKHYDSKVILLIDEYDVPLAKAFENGYYDQMVFLIRNLLEQVLKTNNSLKFAVMTGCMRISKESIFTGLNNLKVLSITDERYDEYFGFTDTEVREMLKYYEIEDHYEEVKNWYDGYQFGGVEVYCPWDVLNYCNNLKVLSITDERYDEYFGFTDTEVREMLKYYEIEDHYEEVKNWYDGYQFGGVEVYCPWDVLNYCDKLKDHADSFPENYWINTSSNDAVKKFIQMSGNFKTKREIETLLAGEEIIKEIHQELVSPEMYQSIENVWSLLFMTGYLTQRGRVDAKRYKLAIPNLEIRDIFETQIMEYFKESVAKDGDTLSRFCDALKNGEETKVAEIFESYLKKTISIRDTFVRKASKENFYHGILLGILGVKEEWYVSSNQESGEGYSDILIETENSETAILIEVKYAGDGNLDAACERALKQVEERKYDEELRENGMDKILKYGIACYMKRCKVKLANA